MSIKNISYKKAAFFFAAFFIFKAHSKEGVETWEEVKKVAGQLLLKKQKSESLQVVNKFLKNEANKAYAAEANEFIIKISQTFISKDAQDAYEASLNATLDNPKEANKQVDLCLQLEIENIDCLIQKIRLAYRDKNREVAEKNLLIVDGFAHGTEVYSWIEMFLQKDTTGGGFKDKTILKRFSDKLNDETFVLTVLEVERSFAAKNFSRAKSGIEILERNDPDYPDIIYFKQKLDLDSAEIKASVGSEGNVMYVTKCKSLTKSMARKFRYDFDLCQRGPL
jgi:hypothetical protein